MNETSPQQESSAPPVKGGIVAYLQIDGAMKAADFYVRAFSAERVAAHPADDHGRTMHVHLYIQGSSLMLSDPFPEHGCAAVKPQGFTLLLPVKDIATSWERAVEAGAQVVMSYREMFWGDLYGQLRDPFGVIWAMNQQRDRA